MARGKRTDLPSADSPGEKVTRSTYRFADGAIKRRFNRSWNRTPCRAATDEWKAYARLKETGRIHQTVNHAPPHPEWAKDANGDGIREVHCNTLEGIWTGLRNFLRIFRGVHKKYLNQYTAVFERVYRFKSLTAEAFRMMAIPSTLDPT